MLAPQLATISVRAGISPYQAYEFDSAPSSDL